MFDQVKIQRAYYANTAATYDQAHLGDPEHHIALAFMLGMIGPLGIRSVLDVGAGTGRALSALRDLPDVRAVGLEPSAELRAIGAEKGLSIVDGDAHDLDFPDGAFDLVCAFGVLHHVPHPRRAVAEMLRVARRAVFISDANNFGQGSLLARFVKQSIRALGLWGAADWIKTRGKGYTISEEDGLAYSYSVFDDYPQISAGCSRVHLLNTNGNGPNLYLSASHVGLLGVKAQT